MESPEKNLPAAEWEQVKDLILAAQDEAPDDMATWLDTHCPSQETRHEVERLLQASAAAGDFLQGSASERHLGLKAPHPARIGRYRIMDELGSGGLGVVYAAQDDLLNRPVALKVLRTPGSPSGESGKRLRWDARAASALQHPNIVVVHDIGNDQGLDYIVMERIAGQTLNQVLAEGGLAPARAVRIALQIVSGLEIAHAANIVHRDLKPTNIMITAEDAVKILDFGLAKPDPALLQNTEAPLTIEGRFAGTAAYVAPEQAEGQTVDARADIFSFGCVFFEMLTGRQAYEGKSAMSVVAKILQQEAPKLTNLNPDLDPRLGEVVQKCLRRDPADRFQSATELKRYLTDCLAPLRTVLPTISWRRTGWFGWAAVLGVVALTCAATWMAARRLSDPVSPAPFYNLARLAADFGLNEQPAISSDGKFIAFASDRTEKGNLAIFLQNSSGGDPHRLTEGTDNAYEPAFSPDGTQLVFRSDAGGGGLYAVATWGGVPRLLVAGGRDGRFSPNGKWLAFWTGEVGSEMLPGTAKAMYVRSTGGAAEELAPSLDSSADPVWDPTGRKLLCVGRGKGMDKVIWWLLDFAEHSAQPSTLSPYGGNEKLTAPEGSLWVTPAAWLADQTVLMSIKQGDSNNIWGMRVSSDGKRLEEPRRLTGGTALELHPSGFVGPDQTLRLVYDAVRVTTAIRKVPLTPAGKAAGDPELLLGGYGGLAAPSLNGDGTRIAFSTRQSTRQIIRVMDLTTGQESTVANLGTTQGVLPILSGDGQWLAYYMSNVGYLISSRGGTAEVLCNHCGPATDVSFDGSEALAESGSVINQLLLCSRNKEPRPIARIVDAPKMLMTEGRWSQDRRWILFCGAENRKRAVYLAPVTPDGTVMRSQLVAVSGSDHDARQPVWSRDGRHVYFIAKLDGFPCIWGRDIDAASGLPTGGAFEVAHFHRPREIIRGPTAYDEDIGLSAAGRFLAFTVADRSGEVWLKTETQNNR